MKLCYEQAGIICQLLFQEAKEYQGEADVFQNYTKSIFTLKHILRHLKRPQSVQI